MRRRRAAVTATVVVGVLLLAAAAGVGGYLITWHERRADHVAVSRSPLPRPAALRSATADAPAPATQLPVPPAGAAATRRGVEQALAPLLHAPALGRQFRAEVVDAATGRPVFTHGATGASPPASTAKLLTAAAVLTVLPSTYRIATTARLNGDGTLVLVGGGDPTLTAAAAGHAGAYPDAARLADLARQIRSRHRAVRRIVVDDSLFTGPAVSPAWAREDVPSSYASAITPVMADGGRATPGAAIRSARPDLAAGREFAAALHRPRLPVSRGRGRGAVVAEVRSAPVGVLVEQMLQESDDVIAECLARQVALARHRPASFRGAAAAIRETVHGVGIDVGDGMVDGSGLAARDRLTPAALTGVLRAVLSRRSLRPVLAGLPVAGWSGTLVDRYLSGSARAGAGVIRAKTGTLTGVSTLAGTVHDRSGQLLTFALMAGHAGATPAAEAALDAIASRLARCGCGRPGG